jgi:uncharacterized protein YodC (DUF2158 family)
LAKLNLDIARLKALNFTRDLTEVLNRHSVDSILSVPDFILAEFIVEIIRLSKNMLEDRYEKFGSVIVKKINKISVGDKVRFRSGGPVMLVSSLDDDDDKCVCRWFDGNSLRSEKFDLNTLELIGD